MTGWIIIGAIDAAVLLGFRLLGGFGAAGDALKNWGCAAGQAGPARCN